jgi:hypothetical protein
VVVEVGMSQLKVHITLVVQVRVVLELALL